jgi:serine/threonine protein kinase
MNDGLLLGEADCGDLQSYIDRGDNKINNALQKTWSLQIAEALAHVHRKGIIHSNVCPNNVLVHKGSLILADFGGSRCRELDLDGQLLPDPPFFDPRLTDFHTPKVDVFSLGVLLYIINTGWYPFHQGPVPQGVERFVYEDYVQALFEQGKFPDLLGVQFGDVISGCCVKRRFSTAEEVAAALKAEMRSCAPIASNNGVDADEGYE